MKQSALVIATLFAAVQANKNHDDARARMQRDIHGYLQNGLKFDAKVYEAVHQNEIRHARITNHFKQEARENLADGHDVMDQYVSALKYEQKQASFTKPSAANGQWGAFHLNNPQKVMDGWVKAKEADDKVGQEWAEDFEQYADRTNKSHQIMGNQIEKAWNQNGKKAVQFADSAINNAQEMHSLAGVDSAEVKEDLRHYVNSVVDAQEAVRHTIRMQEHLDQKPDRAADIANHKFIKEKLQINKGYAKAIEYEIKNTHFDIGQKGGEGHLDWSNKQQIVDHWAKPIAADDIAKDQWMNTMIKVQKEKAMNHQLVKAEAQKVWPKKFEAIQKTWQALGENFDQQHSLATVQQIEAYNGKIHQDISRVMHSEHDLAGSVVDNVVTYNNNTLPEQKEWQENVQTYVDFKKIINKEYAQAFQYEAKNIHVTNTNGKITITENNSDQIIENYANAASNDTTNNIYLKDMWVRYQNSIAADKAAFKATAKAQWPQKFDAVKAAVGNFQNTLEHQPHILITDGEQHLAEKVRGQVYDNINDRLELKYVVKADLKDYMENTNGARDNLKKDVADWKEASKRVGDMYAAAWSYQVAETKFTQATNTAPAHIELQNADKVSDNWRAAAQADEDLAARERGDVMDYVKAIRPANEELKGEINNHFIPLVERINQSDTHIVEEVVNYYGPKAHAHAEQVHHHMHNMTNDIARPAMVHPYHHLMSVESSSNMTLNEQLAYGSVFLMALVAIAALSNKGKAESKSVEFDVEDLEMTNKKESKKQIKNTLKQIMKTSNTKVTLMNN